METDPDATGLKESVDNLEQSIKRLENASAFRSKKALMWAFIRGIVNGLGMIAAVAIVLPILIIIAHQIQWVPLVGDFVLSVLERMGAAAQ